nr:hypothetical protein L204_02116 [Cryptococcus depauperatus CBS 7855]
MVIGAVLLYAFSDFALPRVHHDDGFPHSRCHRYEKLGRADGVSAIIFDLPFITALREDLECIVFLGGIGLSETSSSVLDGGLGGLFVGAVCACLLFSSTSPLSPHNYYIFLSASLSHRRLTGLLRFMLS